MIITRTIKPIVSTDWLSERINNPELLIIDIRSKEDYQAGHIPGAINVPFRTWSTTRSGLILEVPDESDLFQVIGSNGLKFDSQVIIVNKADNPFPLADANRVADTIIYAGFGNVAILDGGHDKWVREARFLSNEVVESKAIKFEGSINKSMFVSRDYVQNKLGKSVILDTRDPNYYFGADREPYAARAGHIPGAKCLPAPWVWNKDGTYRNIDELREMAFNVAGQDSQEIIIYCGVGGFTSTWWFILTQMLRYQNVKFYDGSIQDWTREPEMPLVMFRWE